MIDDLIAYGVVNTKNVVEIDKKFKNMKRFIHANDAFLLVAICGTTSIMFYFRYTNNDCIADIPGTSIDIRT